MSSTLVAVFDEHSEAQQACSKLQSAGIDKRAIQLNGSDPATLPVERRSDSDDQPGAISRFFSDLFGIDDEPNAKHYSEAMRHGNTVLTVSVADEDRVGEISDLLDDCGAVNVDERAEQWQGAAGIPASGQPMARTDSGDNETLKVVEENMQVGTRTLQKGNVRVHRRMIETPVEEQVSLRDESASIARTKVDRPATEADLQSAFKDRDIDIQETTQEPVISKSARVVEEVTVGKKATDRTETVRDTLRRTEVDVENAGGAAIKRYAGTERRVRRDPAYSGAERRMAA